MWLDNLIEMKRDAGKTLKQISEESGVSPGTVNKIFAGQTEAPKLETIKAIVYSLGFTLDDLDPPPQTHPSAKPGTSAMKLARLYDTLDAHGRELVQLVAEMEARRMEAEAAQPQQQPAEAEPEIPLIKHYLVAPAAGYAAPIEGEDYEMIPLPPGAPRNADFCVNVSGDSMEPYIRDGELVYVKRDAPLSLFDVGIFFLNGDVYIKQFCIDHTGTVYLLSANSKRESANKVVRPDSSSTFVCYGKVLLSHRLPQPYYN